MITADCPELHAPAYVMECLPEAELARDIFDALPESDKRKLGNTELNVINVFPEAIRLRDYNPACIGFAGFAGEVLVTGLRKISTEHGRDNELAEIMLEGVSERRVSTDIHVGSVALDPTLINTGALDIAFSQLLEDFAQQDTPIVRRYLPGVVV